MIHPTIQAKANALLDANRQSHRLFVRVTWSTGQTLRVLAKQHKLLEDVLKLQTSHSDYYKTPFAVRSIVVLEEVPRGPVWLR